MEFFAYLDLHLVYLAVFSIGLAIGAGAALVSSMLLMTALRDRTISTEEYRMLTQTRVAMWAGFILYGLSGVGLFTLSYQAMLSLGIFYASMCIVAMLLVNAFAFHYWLLPMVRAHTARRQKKSEFLKADGAYVIASEAVTAVSWLFLVLYHAMYRAPLGFFVVMAAYFTGVLILGGIYAFVARSMLAPEGVRALRTIGITLGVCAVVSVGGAAGSTFLMGAGGGDMRMTTETAFEADAPENTTYTLEEVAQHDTVEDCWVAIDDMVYDVTPAAAMFPEVYQCGTDSTETYRTIRSEGVSERVRSYEIGRLGYAREDVAVHTTQDNCWLIINDRVFDATPEARLHPAAFNCGSDATENYTRNHGELSDTMLALQIGWVDDGVRTQPDDASAQTREALAPQRELYVDDGTWEPEELMVVVEKDAENVLFIDGTTYTEVGRVRDVGYQPHTSVFSPDAHYMYIIARNGWLTKIDLTTLEPVAWVLVGENSRGTALTEDGAYLAIGNYEPGNIVLLDADTLEILKTIPTTGEQGGQMVESRVGGIVEDGQRIIAALKDLNSVWIIDTAAPDFPVVERYDNIGNNETPLHDAYLTPDGRFYIVASMGSHTVWVLDTETWEPIGEITTGETPHTGPGATWGDYTYVPALGEGLITVINTTTWEPEAYIETGGPGLFIRSFSEDPTYPYVWADTAFGEQHDEIYVIDARTQEIVETLRPVPGESSWHPEFTNDGAYVYVVSQTGGEITVYDAHTFEVVTRIEAATPSAVSNVGNRIEEAGL